MLEKLRILMKAGIIKLMILAFLVYFVSESLLRQAAVSNINPQSVNIDALLVKLPPSIRESVNNRIDDTRFRNAIRDAANDSDRVSAILAFADYGHDAVRKLWLYSEVLKEYPNVPETGRVYAAFLLNDSDGPNFTPADYQGFVLLFDQMTAYNIWVQGINRMILANQKPEDLQKFMSPLLSLKPEYKEYGRIYQEMSNLAKKQGNKELAGKCDALVASCKKLPGFEETLKKRAAEEAKKAEAQSKAKGG